MGERERDWKGGSSEPWARLLCIRCCNYYENNLNSFFECTPTNAHVSAGPNIRANEFSMFVISTTEITVMHHLRLRKPLLVTTWGEPFRSFRHEYSNFMFMKNIPGDFVFTRSMQTRASCCGDFAPSAATSRGGLRVVPCQSLWSWLASRSSALSAHLE